MLSLYLFNYPSIYLSIYESIYLSLPRPLSLSPPSLPATLPSRHPPPPKISTCAKLHVTPPRTQPYSAANRPPSPPPRLSPRPPAATRPPAHSFSAPPPPRPCRLNRRRLSQATSCDTHMLKILIHHGADLSALGADGLTVRWGRGAAGGRSAAPRNPIRARGVRHGAIAATAQSPRPWPSRQTPEALAAGGPAGRSRGSGWRRESLPVGRAQWGRCESLPGRRRGPV